MEKLTPRLEQRLEARLKLIPQFWQVVSLLQLPITQLKEELEQEFEENPLLEIEDGDTETSIPKEDEFEIEDENAWIKRKEKFSFDAEKKKEYLETLVTKPETLQEHLLRQLHLQILDKKSCLVGEEIIGNIDENGYLNITLKEIAQKHKISLQKTENILKLIQKFDPAGVAARDLKECLILQLKLKGLKEKIFENIIEKFLPEIASRQYEKIEKRMNISSKEMNKFLNILKTLDPKPGRNYTKIFPNYAIPEISLEIDTEGNYSLKIIGKNLPRVRINKEYIQLLKDHNTPGETKKYLREKMKSAKELISALEQRNKTILKIANFIMEYQKDFFINGKSSLKPLVLREVANATALDESTISRAIHGKYMETPSGIIELREFFSSQVNGTSSKAIKERIKDIIVSENPKKPLSDSKISQILKQEGIEIARRTVAKYREDLKILPAKLRRR